MRLVFDLEANGLYHTADTIWCICALDIDTQERYVWKDGDNRNKVTEFMEEASHLIGHNIINYDLPLLKKLWGWVPDENTEIVDTLVMSRLANPDRRKPATYAGKGGPHSLEAWGYRVGKGKLHHEEWGVFSPAMLRRCDGDVDITQVVYSTVSYELKDFSKESIELEHDIARIITNQEHHGIRFDLKAAKEYVKDLTRRIEQIDDVVVPLLPKELVVGNPISHPFLKMGGYRKTTKDYISKVLEEDRKSHWKKNNLIGGPFTRVSFKDFNLGSVEKIKDYLLENGWKPEVWNYSKKTKERTSPKLEGNFEGIDGEIPRQVKERILWRSRRSYIEGWINNAVPDRGVRLDSEDSSRYRYWKLYAGANPCGTNTNRMRHHTVANITKANTDKTTGDLCWDVEKQKDVYGTQMRSLFIPREGFVIAGHDASSIQLRMLAHYMNDEEFIKEILSGDIHSFNQRRAGLSTRDQAKTFIYALIYGAGDERIGGIVGGDSRTGAELKDRYFRELPKLSKFIEKVKRASGKGYLKGLDGRRLYVRRDDKGRVRRSTACNVLLQSADSIVMKRSSKILWENVQKQGIYAHKILDMHDEGQSEVRNLPEYIEPYKELCVNSIVEAGEYYNLNIPLAAEVKLGMNLAETH